MTRGLKLQRLVLNRPIVTALISIPQRGNKDIAAFLGDDSDAGKWAFVADGRGFLIKLGKSVDQFFYSSACSGLHWLSFGVALATNCPQDCE